MGLPSPSPGLGLCPRPHQGPIPGPFFASRLQPVFSVNPYAISALQAVTSASFCAAESSWLFAFVLT